MMVFILCIQDYMPITPMEYIAIMCHQDDVYDY